MQEVGRRMFEHGRALNEFLVNYLENLVRDLEEPDLDLPPFAGLNPPRWILGHLAVNNDYALRIFGGRFQCPKEWHRSYARGTTSSSPTVVDASKELLMERIRSGFAELRQRTEAADPDAMSRPHSIPFLEATPIKTVGQVVTHLLTTHPATHLGQLSAWRRATGRPSVSLGSEGT